WLELSRYLPYPLLVAPAVVALLFSIRLGWRWLVAAAATIAAFATLAMGFVWNADPGDDAAVDVRFMTYNVKALLAIERRGGLAALAAEVDVRPARGEARSAVRDREPLAAAQLHDGARRFRGGAACLRALHRRPSRRRVRDRRRPLRVAAHRPGRRAPGRLRWHRALAEQPRRPRRAGARARGGAARERASAGGRRRSQRARRVGGDPGAARDRPARRLRDRRPRLGPHL